MKTLNTLRYGHHGVPHQREACFDRGELRWDYSAECERCGWSGAVRESWAEACIDADWHTARPRYDVLLNNLGTMLAIAVMGVVVVPAVVVVVPVIVAINLILTARRRRTSGSGLAVDLADAHVRLAR
jgi:hypothetical protein